MEFTSNDFKILMASVIWIVALSFVFPAMGVGNADIGESDFPEFNVTTDRFGSYLEQPEFPRNPEAGVINHSSTQFDNSRGSIQHELGDGTSGERIFIVAIEENETHIVNTSILDNHVFSSNDETATLTGDGFEIDVHSVDISTGEYEYRVQDRPGTISWIESVPVLSDVVGAGADLAGILAWIALMANFFIIEIVVSGALNIAGVVFDIVAFFIGVLHFIIVNYAALMTGVNAGWASVIVAIPGLMFGISFGKIVVILVDIAPIPFT